MSDHDAAPDPIDKVYVQAEAVLNDELARAARRARVLAAVASEAARAGSLPLTRRPAWRRGRWLAAAGVAGLGLILAAQIYQPAWRQPQTAPSASAPAASGSAVKGMAASPAPPTAALSQPAPPRVVTAAPRAGPPVPPEPRTVPPPQPLSIPPLLALPAPSAFPDAAPPPPPPASRQSIIVTAERRSSRDAMADQNAARAAEPAAPAVGESGFVAAAPSDLAARLRAAAAAGRADEVEAVLAQGVSVDAPDAEGNTALMDAIQADHPTAAASLRRHDASLDRKNHAGESARDMATAKGDPALNQALGLAP